MRVHIVAFINGHRERFLFFDQEKLDKFEEAVRAGNSGFVTVISMDHGKKVNIKPSSVDLYYFL